MSFKTVTDLSSSFEYSNIYNIAIGFDVGINSFLLSDNASQKVLLEPWLVSNYSKRIWNNNEQFIERVRQTIKDGITGGHGISRMADKLEDIRPYTKTAVVQRLWQALLLRHVLPARPGNR